MVGTKIKKYIRPSGNSFVIFEEQKLVLIRDNTALITSSKYLVNIWPEEKLSIWFKFLRAG